MNLDGTIPQATFQRPTTDSLQVTLNGALRTKVDSNGANVMVALYESGLVTDITAGENKGRVLANDFVVRKLEKLCSVKDASAKKAVSGTVTFSLWETFDGAKCGVAVFVQDNSHHIFGSQMFQLPEDVWKLGRNWTCVIGFVLGGWQWRQVLIGAKMDRGGCFYVQDVLKMFGRVWLLFNFFFIISLNSFVILFITITYFKKEKKKKREKKVVVFFMWEIGYTF